MPTRCINSITTDNTIRLEGSAPKRGARGTDRGLIPARFILARSSVRCQSEITCARRMCFHQEMALFKSFSATKEKINSQGHKWKRMLERSGHKRVKRFRPRSKTAEALSRPIIQKRSAQAEKRSWSTVSAMWAEAPAASSLCALKKPVWCLSVLWFLFHRPLPPRHLAHQ